MRHDCRGRAHHRKTWAVGRRRTTASNAVANSSQLCRMSSKPLNLASQDISDAALRLNHLRRARVPFQLAAEAKNLHVDTAIENVFVHASRLQEMLSAQRTLGSVQERDKQCIFPLRQGDRGAVRVGKTSRTAAKLPAKKPIAASLGVAGRCCDAWTESAPQMLQTERGVGYIFACQVERF